MARKACAAMSKRLRSSVSASTPPTKSNMTSGAMSAVCTSATRMEACGCRTSNHCAPTVCIHVPMLLARAASHRARNARMRSGVQADAVFESLTLPLGPGVPGGPGS